MKGSNNPPMSEAQLVSAILSALKVAGWRAVHFRPARTAHGWRTAMTGDAGVPDIIAVHPRLGVLLIETKSDVGRLRPEQVEWREWCEAAALSWPGAIRYAVARPKDWYAGDLDGLLGFDGRME